jgi:hypothetical protein
VNNILTSKVLPPRVGYLVDDFCCFTLTITWLLSNCLFWPILTNAWLIFLVGSLEVLWFAANVYRTYWNYRNEKIGIIHSGNASVERLVEGGRQRGCTARRAHTAATKRHASLLHILPLPRCARILSSGSMLLGGLSPVCVCVCVC